MADYHYESLLSRLLAHDHRMVRCQNPACTAAFVAPSHDGDFPATTCPYCGHGLQATNTSGLPDDVDVASRIVPPAFDKDGARARGFSIGSRDFRTYPYASSPLRGT